MPGTKLLQYFRAEHMRRNLTVALLALCAVGILTIAAAIEMFSISGETARYQAVLEKSIEQRSQLRRTLLLILRAEASQRGYLLTRENAYHTQFMRDSEDLPPELSEMLASFSNSEVQLARGRQLADLIETRLEQLSTVLEQFRQDQPQEPVIETGRATAALRTMTALHGLVDDMIALEGAEISAAAQQLEAQSRWSRTVMLLLFASIVVLTSAVLGLGVVHLSHREQIEHQLREAGHLAEQTSRAKTDFLASMSHEIRTPLATILGYTELLLEEKLTAQQIQFVERLQLAGRGLSEIVNDILDFSKVEAGEITLEAEPLSIGALVGDVLSIVSISARSKNIELRHEIDPNLPEQVSGDPMRLRQVLLNLLTNGVKFTHEGSVTLTVRREDSSPDGAMIRFEVTDTGVGIPADKQDLIFRRFSQLDSTIQREYGGTGLGLAISKSLVELMGGQIGVESEPGRGATFWLVVPLPKVADSEAVTAGEHEAPRVSGSRVLLVEDLPQNRDLVSTIMTRAGYEIDIAVNGEQALAAVQTAHYDLVLMDMQMPHMDGLEATRRIRELEGPVRDVPIIAMTANVLPEHLDQFRKAGATAHIGKPFRKAVLLETVARWLSPRAAGAFQGPSSSTSRRTFEPEVFEEARELMGEEWIQACLMRLRVNLAELLGSEVGTPLDPAALKRRAHQIVADAGQLGLLELSQCCRELDNACTYERDVDRTLERARKAARLAQKAMDGLPPGIGGT